MRIPVMFAVAGIVLTVLATSHGVAYRFGQLDEANEWERARDEWQIEQLNRDIAAREENDRLRAEHALEVETFMLLAEDLYDALENPGAACFVGDDADRLRRLWGSDADR